MAQRFVAFLDVLGFKSIVERISQTELLDAYRQLQEAARRQTARPRFPDDQRRFDADAHYAFEEIAWSRVVNVVVASDSVVVYSQSDSREDFSAVSAGVRGLLVEGFRQGLPLRGAICLGELDEIDIADDVINSGEWTGRFSGLVGLGLTKAYGLEGDSTWSGAVLEDRVVDHLAASNVAIHHDGPLTELLAACSGHMLLQTEVPWKVSKEHASPAWVVHWPFLAGVAGRELTREQVRDSFSSFGRILDDRSKRKRDETLAFFDRATDEHTATFERLLDSG